MECKKCGGDRDSDTSDAMQPGDNLCASCDAEDRDGDPGVIYVDVPDWASLSDPESAWRNVATFPRTAEGRASALAFIREHIGECDDDGKIGLLSNDL